jgi:thiamine-monophosphate kinase
LADLGERALIERLRAIFAAASLGGEARRGASTGASATSARAESLRTRLGIGDDCAVLAPPAPGEEVLLEVDEAIDGVHFRLDWMTAEDAGHRLATQGLSDLAAMGGTPRAALLALGAPGDLGADTLLAIAGGLAAQLARFGVEVVGGNVAASAGPLHLTLTVVGVVEQGRAVLRSGARPGDLLAVTGPIGLARAGWLLCERGLADRPAAAPALAAYRRPEPRVEVGRALARAGLARAMIDLSDGLAGDLAQLCRASGVGARIDEPALALHLAPGLAAAAALLGADPLALALAGGDDFELLVAVAPDRWDEAHALAERCGSPLARVGAITDPGAGLVLARQDGASTPLPGVSYEHFRGSR